MAASYARSCFAMQAIAARDDLTYSRGLYFDHITGGGGSEFVLQLPKRLKVATLDEKGSVHIQVVGCLAANKDGTASTCCCNNACSAQRAVTCGIVAIDFDRCMILQRRRSTQRCAHVVGAVCIRFDVGQNTPCLIGSSEGSCWVTWFPIVDGRPKYKR